MTSSTRCSIRAHRHDDEPARAPRRRFAAGNALPALTGFGTLVAFFLAVELLIQTGVLNRFIIPPPSEIIASFPRVIVEEHVLGRFVQTLTECLAAGVMLTVFGVAGRCSDASLQICCSRRPKPGSQRSPRPRSCSAIRCSW